MENNIRQQSPKGNKLFLYFLHQPIFSETIEINCSNRGALHFNNVFNSSEDRLLVVLTLMNQIYALGTTLKCTAANYG